MTKALKIRVVNLRSEFLAHTFGILVLLTPARTVAAAFLKAFLYDLYNFFIRIKAYFHIITSYSILLYTIIIISNKYIIRN